MDTDIQDSPGTIHFIITDDNKDTRNGYRRLIQSITNIRYAANSNQTPGTNVVFHMCGDGQEASVYIASLHQKGALKRTILVTDDFMPGGISGNDLINTLAESTSDDMRNLPRILISGRVQEDLHSNPKQLLLIKPMDSDLFFSQIKSFLNTIDGHIETTKVKRIVGDPMAQQIARNANQRQVALSQEEARRHEDLIKREQQRQQRAGETAKHVLWTNRSRGICPTGALAHGTNKDSVHRPYAYSDTEFMRRCRQNEHSQNEHIRNKC